MEANTWSGKIYVAIDWIVKLVFVNILFIVANIVTILAFVNYLIGNSVGELIFAAILLVIAAIFFTFPAMMSVYSVIRHLVKEGRTIRTFKVYVQSYKDNYLRSVLGGLVFSFVSFIAVFYYLYFHLSQYVVLQYIAYALVVYFVMVVMHFFSVNVHFHITFIQSLKNAILFTIKNPILSFLCSFMVIFTIFISVKIPILFLLITIPIIAYMSFQIFYHRSIKGIANEENSSKV